MNNALDEVKSLTNSQSPVDRLIADFVAAHEKQAKTIMDLTRAMNGPDRDGNMPTEGRKQEELKLAGLAICLMGWDREFNSLAVRTRDQMHYLTPDKPK